MTDDSWRKRRDEETDFGPPLFGDDAATDSGSGGIPTGEPTDDLDVWSSFSGQSPSSRDGFGAESSDGLDDITGLSPVFEQPDDDLFEDPAVVTRDESVPVRREQGRITIGTDPTDGAASRPTSSGRRPRGQPHQRRHDGGRRDDAQPGAAVVQP